MSWVSRFIYANLNYLLGGLVLLMVFICGVQIGEARVQREWNAEKLRAALVAAKQEQRAADVQQSQSQINQEISNEYAKNAKALGSRLPGLRPVGVCISAPISAGSVPTVSEAPAGAASLPADALSFTAGDAGAVSCAQLSKDAAQTTLMLLEVQRWYQKQSAIEP
ncbi:MAG: hypothetical protein ACOYB1_19585 [Limnohabitans sp.]